MASKRYNRLDFNSNPAGKIVKALQYVIEAGRVTSKRFNRAAFNRPVTMATTIITKQLAYVIEVINNVVPVLYYILFTSVIIKTLQYYISQAALTKAVGYAIKVLPDAIVVPLRYVIEAHSALTFKVVLYTIRTTQQKTTSIRYRIRGTPSATIKVVHYFVRAVVQPLEVSLSYFINVVQSTIKVAQYCIKSSIPILKALTYEIIREVGLVKQVAYYIGRTIPAIEVGVLYYVKQPPIELSLQYYVIRNQSIIETVSRFNRRCFNRAFAQVTLLTKNVTYYIGWTADAILVGVEYCIETSTPSTKALQYYVQAIVLQSVPVQWCIRYVQTPITKAVEYRITTGPSGILGVLYTVRASIPVTRALTYVVQAAISGLTKAVQYKIGLVYLVHEPQMYKQTVVVGSPGSANYTCEVVVPWDSKMATDFSDLRFGDDSTGAMYAATRVSYTPSSTATFQCTIPTAGQATFTMYYGNTTLVVQADIVSPVGAVGGTPSGTELMNETFLYRYVIGAIV